MQSSKLAAYGRWGLICLTSMVFLVAGGAKLAGVEAVHQSFSQMGLPVFTGYLVGILEIVGAVALLVRRLSAFAALGLGMIMVGASGYHVVFDPLSAVVPAVILLIMNLVIFLLRRQENKLKIQ